MNSFYHSTRGKTDNVTSKQAILRGIAPDGGLYVADWIGEEKLDLTQVCNQTFQENARLVLGTLLPDYTEAEIAECVGAAYGEQWDTPSCCPVSALGDDWLLELYHGPTSAFKDVALQMLPQLLGGNDGGLAGGGQGRGNGQHQHILPLSQAGRHGGGPALRVDGGGGGGDPPAQLLVEGLYGGGLGEILVVFSVVGNGQGDRGHIQLLLLGAGEVTAGVGEDRIGVSHSLHTPIITVKMRRRKIPVGCRRHFQKTVLS